MTNNMSRPTRIYIDTQALLHNVQRVKEFAPQRKIIAMVKANAYGCGLPVVCKALDGHVDAFGVACMEEALTLRALGIISECILMQGLFSPDELPQFLQYNLQCVIHQMSQLEWIVASPLPKKIKVWVKVDTGMHRLGFAPHEVMHVMQLLQTCPWIDAEIGLMTHFACADEPNHPNNARQLSAFNDLPDFGANIKRSLANSAAIIAWPDMVADVVRPGIMLYGVSPFSHQTGVDLGLKPVMHFQSQITVIHHYPNGAAIGYSGRWICQRNSRIGIVAAGYGDGYPRHIAPDTCVWLNGHYVPVVGRVSMDMLTIDLTDTPDVKVGAQVELWGQHVPVEEVATSAGTIPYELLCQVTQRVRVS